MATFVKVSKTEFEDWADNELLSWEWCVVKQGKELVIRSKVDLDIKDGIEFHIYTTIAQGQEKVRDIGKDAIRCVLYDAKSCRPVSGTKKVLRTEGATTVFQRIVNRLDELFADPYSGLAFCKKCGSHLVERTNRATGAKFMGCSGYPECPRPVNQLKYPLLLLTEQKVGTNHVEPIARTENPPYEKLNTEINQLKKQVIKTNTPIITAPTPSNSSSEKLVKDSELVPTSAYPHAQFPFLYFNRVQSTIMKKGYWRKDCNLVLGTTTSSGKTVAAELFMAYTMEQELE